MGPETPHRAPGFSLPSRLPQPSFFAFAILRFILRRACLDVDALMLVALGKIVLEEAAFRFLWEDPEVIETELAACYFDEDSPSLGCFPQAIWFGADD